MKRLHICSVAEGLGVPCMIGCKMESRVAVTAAAHLASTSGCITRIDLDSPLMREEDPVIGGAKLSGPEITVGLAEGLPDNHRGYRFLHRIGQEAYQWIEGVLYP